MPHLSYDGGTSKPDYIIDISHCVACWAETILCQCALPLLPDWPVCYRTEPVLLRSWLFLVCRAETHMFWKTFWHMSYYLSQILLPEPFTIWNHFLKSRILILVLFPESVLIPEPFAIWRLHRIGSIEFRFSKKQWTLLLSDGRQVDTYVSTRPFFKQV